MIFKGIPVDKLLFILGAMTVMVETVKINNLRVPKLARHGGHSVILDCDYTLEDSHDGLVVKWFFNDRPEPVYQWIPRKKPQGLGILKDKLNLEYQASKDINSMHRALHIIKPSAELSGEYTCVVSTFHNEDRRSEKMLVFVSEKSLSLRQERSPEGDIRLTCSAEGVYPKPSLTLRFQHQELSKTKYPQRETKDGLYDISTSVILPEEIIDNQNIFECELRIPEANYTVKKEYVYIPGSTSSRLETLPQFLLCFVTFFFLFF